MVVRRLSLEPGARFASDSPGGSIIVFLTTELDGRMPRRRSHGAIRDRRRWRIAEARFEALIVDLKGR